MEITQEISIDRTAAIVRVYEEMQQNARLTIKKAVELGGLLTEQKLLLAHGEWGDWADENLPFSHKTAQRYMRLYDNRERFKNDSVSFLTEGYRLLSVPQDEEPETKVAATNKSEKDKKGRKIEAEIVDDPDPETEPEKSDGKALVADAEGRNVPDHLHEIFLEHGDIKAFVNLLDKLKKDVNTAIEAKPKLWFFFRSNPFGTELANVRRQFTFAVPHAVCPYCGGIDSDKCTGCKGGGFLNHDGYLAAPEELKKKGMTKLLPPACHQHVGGGKESSCTN